MTAATILVVDDERNILTSVSRALGLEGYEVEVAGSAEVALEKLSKQTFDAILLDVQLPGIDGLEMLDELQKLDSDTEVDVSGAYHAPEGDEAPRITVEEVR